MNARIRYVKLGEHGGFQTTRMYNHPTNGARYKVWLNTMENEWQVIDDVSELVSVSGRDVNLGRMKKAAKEALIVLGIEFETETGNRKPYTKKTTTAA